MVRSQFLSTLRHSTIYSLLALNSVLYCYSLNPIAWQHFTSELGGQLVRLVDVYAAEVAAPSTQAIRGIEFVRIVDPTSSTAASPSGPSRYLTPREHRQPQAEV